MKNTDESLLRSVEGFYDAAMGAVSWNEALESLAAATGSRIGQLVGLGPEIGIQFNWMSGEGAGLGAELFNTHADDPAINPFVRGGSECPVLSVAASADFISREERRQNEFLQTHAKRWDIPHICLSPLFRQNDSQLGLAVLRSKRQGEITADQRRTFATIAPHVQAAVRLQLSIEHSGSLSMARALEALSVTAFVCDRRGEVRAMTPAAQQLLDAGKYLRLCERQLHASSRFESQVLRQSIDRAAAGIPLTGPSAATTLTVGQGTAQPRLLEVLPLPARTDGFSFEPRVLVVVKHAPQPRQCDRQRLQDAFGLTPSEAEVALGLMQGLSAADIARERRAALGTVRKQIRAVCEKMDCHRQGEIIAKLPVLLG